MNRLSALSLLLLLLLLPLLISAECTCDSDPEKQSSSSSRTAATRYKLAAIFSILAASLIGVALPFLGKKIPALLPEKDVFFSVKAFAAGVILATGFVHVLPDAFESLKRPCLSDNPWGSFPSSGFVAMISAIGMMMMDALATGFYRRLQRIQALPVKEDGEVQCENQDHVHGQSHGSAFISGKQGSPELVRRRIGIGGGWGLWFIQAIIGISLGAAASPKTIKPLVAAFLGSKAIAAMATFFSVTTPIGMAISNIHDENSRPPGRRALVVEGVLNSGSAGILIDLHEPNNAKQFQAPNCSLQLACPSWPNGLNSNKQSFIFLRG